MSATEFERLLALTADGVQSLQEVMVRILETDIDLVRDVCDHIFAGGKRLRAVVAMLSMSECRVDEELCHRIAAAIEFIHSATLLHDDVVDDAWVRRHRKTANRLFGNSSAVLVGDFLYSRASQICAETENTGLIRCFADTTNNLAKGEVIQLINTRDPSYEEKRYFEVIERKTANLFRLAALSGPLLSGRDDLVGPFGVFGWNLGMSFQIIDDCLDYAGDPEVTGKKIGKDLDESKITLPMIYGLETLDPQRRARILAALRQDGVDQESREELFELSAMPGTIQRVQGKAEEHAMVAKRSLLNLGGSRERDLLVDLAGASVFRAR